MKLEKLTPEQEELMVETKNEWVNHYLHSGYETNYETLRPLVDWCYEKAGLKTKPLIFIADDYYSQKLMINYVKIYLNSILKEQVESQVRNQVESQVGRQVESQVRNQVESQVRNQVESQVRNQVGSQVWNQVGRQ